MNFGAALRLVTGFLEEKNFQYAVVGGIALVAYGLPRTTLDVDLAVDSGAREDLIRFLEAHGYQTLHHSSGYSNHKHPDLNWGRLDLVYVQGGTSRELFAGCRRLPGPGGLEIPVPRPEHLAAMKVLAIKNDPERTFREMIDVRFLLNLPGVDRREIESYFDRHDLGDRFDELRKTL